MYQYDSKSKKQPEKSKSNAPTTNKNHMQTAIKIPVQTKSLFSFSTNLYNDGEKTNSDYISRLAQLTPMVTNSPLQMQPMQNQEQQETKPNNTGIPTPLKNHFEALSGLSFDDVRVHYNSNRPAQLQALAYTQGNQVYVSPGQEKQLRHELGHVVQQKQGRVRATTSLNDMAINDDVRLERESDMIGGSNLSLHSEKDSNLLTYYPSANIVQRKLYGNPKNAQELVGKQIELQIKPEKEIAELIEKDNPNDKGAYTTVGFEHEFARFNEYQENNPLEGAAHVELAKSDQILAFTGLPFILETDSDNVIELVGAPLIVATSKEAPVPFADDIKQIDNFIQEKLRIIPQNNFNTLKANFSTHMGLTFQNVYDGNIESLNVQSGSKGGGIAPQVNFATSASAYDAAKDVSDPKSEGVYTKGYKDKEIMYWGKISGIITDIPITPNITIILKELAKNLSLFGFVNYLKIYKKMESKELPRYPRSGPDFMELGMYTSLVKDTNTFWLKDTIYNLGIGLLTKEEWQTTKSICQVMVEDALFNDCREPLNLLIGKIDNFIADDSARVAEQLPVVHFGEHNPGYLGVRQDTYVSLAGKKSAPQFKDNALHLVEMRGASKVANKFNQVEKRLLEKSTLLFDDTPLKCSLEIKYVPMENKVTIDSSPKNPFWRKTKTTIPVSELVGLNIEYEKLEDSEDICVSMIGDSSSSYNFTLDKNQAAQFKYFINRVLAVSSYVST